MTIAKLSVLVVDDSELMRLLLNKMLTELEVGAVRTAGDGNEALGLIAAERPDLIITDQHMAPLDGVEFVRTLRASDDPHVRKLPIIMMTGYAKAQLLRDAVKAGVNDFLAKPISIFTLNERILKVLDHLSAQDAEAEVQGQPAATVARPVSGVGKPLSTGQLATAAY